MTPAQRIQIAQRTIEALDDVIRARLVTSDLGKGDIARLREVLIDSCMLLEREKYPVVWSAPEPHMAYSWCRPDERVQLFRYSCSIRAIRLGIRP